MKPTLAQAYQRRHWLLATSIVENILFSAILLGWPALVSVLKNEGFYSHLCTTLDTRPKATVYDFTTNSTRSRSVEVAVPLLWTDQPPVVPLTASWSSDCCASEKWTCPEQEKALHSCFTVGSFLMNALTILIGLAVNKFGAKWMRAAGTIVIGVALVLFGCSTPRTSHILVYACALTGFGGNIMAYTSLQISNLFGSSRSLSLGLLVGSYAASAIVFPTLKVLYALGISLNILFLLMAVLTLVVLFNILWNIPNVPIPVGVESLSLGECKPILYQSSRREKSDRDHATEAPSHLSNCENHIANSDITEDANVIPLHRIIFMPIFMWSVIVIAITQLRLMFFVGDLHQMLVYMIHNNVETIDLYIFIFGILQICCLGTTHFINGFVDWRNKKTIKPVAPEEELEGYSHQPAHFPISRPLTPIPANAVLLADRGHDRHEIISSPIPYSNRVRVCDNPVDSFPLNDSEVFFNVRKSSIVHLVDNKTSKKATPEVERRASVNSLTRNVPSGAKLIERKIGKLKDCAAVFFVTSTLSLIFGLLVLIPSLTIQVSTFVCYTLIRGFVPCAVGRLYAVAFRSVHHQALVGLAFAVSAVFSLIQQPLFIVVTDYCDGDPYWVNVALLLLSLLAFGLPLHLMFHCRHLEQWRQTSNSNVTVQPVMVKMQYVDNKIPGCATPTEL